MAVAQRGDSKPPNRVTLSKRSRFAERVDDLVETGRTRPKQNDTAGSKPEFASPSGEQSEVPIMRHDCAFVSNSPRKHLIIGRTEAARNDGSDCIKSLSRKPRHDGRRDIFVEQ